MSGFQPVATGFARPKNLARSVKLKISNILLENHGFLVISQTSSEKFFFEKISKMLFLVVFELLTF